MSATETDGVTGAFSFTGQSIARRLLALGREVRTLTGHPDRPDPFGGKVRVVPLDFGDPARLAASLRGVSVLYNTYWIRFPRGRTTYEGAVANTKALLAAAREAGVRRVVHISIANPSAESPLPYYRGKAEVERAIVEGGWSHAIVRPTVIFGPGDILINNIAWFLRRFPVFLLPGSGEYPIQPVFVEDVADLAVQAGLGGKLVVDAAGPDTFSFRELVRLIAAKVGSRARIASASPWQVRLSLGAIGRLVGDVILTPGEIQGLMAGLLASREPSRCPTRIGGWLDAGAGEVGTRYASEVARHYR